MSSLVLCHIGAITPSAVLARRRFVARAQDACPGGKVVHSQGTGFVPWIQDLCLGPRIPARGELGRTASWLASLLFWRARIALTSQACVLASQNGVLASQNGFWPARMASGPARMACWQARMALRRAGNGILPAKTTSWPASMVSWPARIASWPAMIVPWRLHWPPESFPGQSE